MFRCIRTGIYDNIFGKDGCKCREMGVGKIPFPIVFDDPEAPLTLLLSLLLVFRF